MTFDDAILHSRLSFRHKYFELCDIDHQIHQFPFLLQSFHHRLQYLHLDHPNGVSCVCAVSPVNHHFVEYLRYLNPTIRKTDVIDHSFTYFDWIWFEIWTKSYRIFFGHTANLELFGHFNEINQILIVNMDFTHVHEVQNRTQYLTLNTVDEEYRMWAGIFLLN